MLSSSSMSVASLAITEVLGFLYKSTKIINGSLLHKLIASFSLNRYYSAHDLKTATSANETLFFQQPCTISSLFSSRRLHTSAVVGGAAYEFRLQLFCRLTLESSFRFIVFNSRSSSKAPKKSSVSEVPKADLGAIIQKFFNVFIGRYDVAAPNVYVLPRFRFLEQN